MALCGFFAPGHLVFAHVERQHTLVSQAFVVQVVEERSSEECLIEVILIALVTKVAFSDV